VEEIKLISDLQRRSFSIRRRRWRMRLLSRTQNAEGSDTCLPAGRQEKLNKDIKLAK
jgi:hypothetical protein